MEARPTRPLTPGRVDVYALELDLDETTLAPLRGSLDPTETARAGRCIFEVHRRRFTAAHGLLRGLLGGQLGIPPETVRFEYGPTGKPRLGASLPRLRFSVSHSRNRGLIALALDRELGVDIEAVRSPLEHAAIAARFFAPREVHELLALPEQERATAFFDVWTRKEAYLKLNGGGLSVPLDSFEMSLGEPPRLLRDDRDPAAPSRVTLHSPLVPEGFRGALAMDGPAEVHMIEP